MSQVAQDAPGVLASPVPEVTTDLPRPRRRLASGARTRILLAFVLLLGASTLITLVGQRTLLLNRAVERVDRELDQQAAGIAKLAGAARSTGGTSEQTTRRFIDAFLARTAPAPLEGYYSFVDGRPYAALAGRSLPAGTDAEVLPLAASTSGRRGELDPDDERLRYAVVPLRLAGRSTGTLVVVRDLGEEEDEATAAAQGAALIALAVLVVTAFVAWLVAGQVLAPLRRLRDTATAISETDISRRLEVRGHDELAELARTFNGMLDRLETAFASQRAFVSDAGHELRTPITIIRGHLELMGDDPEERAETLALVDDELKRMTRLVDDLLTLAKAERTDFLRPEALDLDELVHSVADKVPALGRRAWEVERADPALLVADRQRLTQAVMNLAANAVHQTRDGDVIRLGGAVEGGWARLWVTDTGPGIAREDQARIFDRFAQAGGLPRVEGAGLGLAIVRVIAEAHGGRVELDSAPGQGARFTIAVPIQEETA